AGAPLRQRRAQDRAVDQGGGAGQGDGRRAGLRLAERGRRHAGRQVPRQARQAEAEGEGRVAGAIAAVRSRGRRVGGAALLALTGGCVVLARPLEPPPNDETTVALLTGTLGPPLDGIARHPWFAVRRKGEQEWHTYEVPSP